MALKALMLRKKIDDKKKDLDALMSVRNGFEAREADLAKSIEEANSDEERSAVEEAIGQFETDKGANDAAVRELEAEIEGLENELKETEEAAPAPASQERKSENKFEERGNANMKVTNFFGMNIQERDQFFARDDVKQFMTRAREALRDIRSLGNAQLTIPEVMLELMEPMIEQNSKLMGKVHTVSIKGIARQVVEGTIPEAVWTEACATLNELDLGFNDVEVDGYKVGGYFSVCNALLEDNDVELANKLMTALAVAIAKGIDKAIVYGTGIKMPLGIATRLAQTSQPADYPATARPWVDLHSTHIIAKNESGTTLFKSIVNAAGLVDNDYFDGDLIWIMNKATHTKLIAESIGVNAAAAIVSGMNNQMPVIGGEIIELPFINDGDIVFGFGKAYTYVQRKGVQIGQSEHYLFVEDKTVIKGTARGDGKPVIAEAFAILHIGSGSADATADFPVDYANEGLKMLTVVSANGSASGKAIFTVSNTVAQSDPTLYYKASYDVNKVKAGQKITGWTSLTSGTTEVTIAAGTPVAVVEVDAAGKAVAAGSALANPKA